MKDLPFPPLFHPANTSPMPKSAPVAVRLSALLLVLLLTGVKPIFAVPQHELAKPPEDPKVAGPSKEGEEAIARFKVAHGLKTKLIAAEPLLANPVAFTIDNSGKIYVCETFRLNHGVEDNRSHNYWLDDDLAAQTVADRVAYVKKHHAKTIGDYTKFDDRVKLLWDTNGDGVMDQHSIFAKHFNQIEDGVGSGVLAVGDRVLFTCIPKLWSLRDTDGDQIADERKPLLDGFGVRFAFTGHDLHGLIMGPDGRVYFSVGDRGFNVKSQEGKEFINPDSGGVFRCEPDGSGLELVAMGLRNPQELAFDDYGNLFTGDNNSDSGDRARWVYVVEGGDTGWRMYYQYLPDRGPFNREKIWHPPHAGQPAYIIPPIVNFADGPSGLAFYPGTGLPDHFKNRFFLCDFRGTPNNSGIKTFRNEADGAFFKLVDAEESVWSILATDVEFGPDGGVYVLDWVDGWGGLGKGRVYRFGDAGIDQSELTKQTSKLLREGVSKAEARELPILLGHADRRVRQLAQFELVRRGDAAALQETAAHAEQPLTRLHAIWGLSQLLRTAKPSTQDVTSISKLLTSLLSEEDAEVRCQAAWVCGDRKIEGATETLFERLPTESPRVKHFFAAALGKLGAKESVPVVLRVLADNDNADPIVRHGAIMGLVGAGADAIQAAALKHPSVAARLGAVVALRKLKSPLVAAYLADGDSLVKLEAARAVHDAAIPEAFSALAGVPLLSSDDDALVRRVLNVRFRLGDANAAESLVAYAGDAANPAAMRVEALQMLADWAKPNGRDRVLGMWRPLEPRNAEVAKNAVQRGLGSLISAPEAVRNQSVKTAVALGIKEIAPALLAIVKDEAEKGENRGSALTALAELKAPEVAALVTEAATDKSPALRVAALSLLVRSKAADAEKLVFKALTSSDRRERQAGYALLAELRTPGADQEIASAMKNLRGAPADVKVEVLEAAKARAENKAVAEAMEVWLDSLDAGDSVAKFRPALEGGDAERGKAIFFGKTDVYCVRCHKVGGTGGEVGPDLSRLAQEKTRDYLLEAIVDPNKAIAKNFESVVIHDVNGRVLTGVLKSKTADSLTIATAEGKFIEIKLADIEEQTVGKSAMPEDVSKKLSLHELRDLLEFLSTLK